MPGTLTVLGQTAAFAMLVFGVCTAFTVHAPLLAWCATFLKGPSASTGLAVMKVMGGLGSFTGPYVIGVIKQHHAGAYVAALWFVSSTLVAAATLCLGTCGWKPAARGMHSETSPTVMPRGRQGGLASHQSVH